MTTTHNQTGQGGRSGRTDPLDVPVHHHDGYPIAQPIRVVHDRSVEVRCPECAGTHWHGWAPDMDDRYSHRVSHCHRGDGYVIAPTGDLT